MKQPLSCLGSLLITLVLLSSCSSKPDVPIPANASLVMHINGESISEKLPWVELKKSPWFQMATEDAMEDSLGSVLMNDPEQSGLDLQSNGWMFVANRGQGAYFGLIWDLSDAEKFEGLIKKSAPDTKIQEKESTRYLTDGSMVVAWKGKKLMLLSDASEFTRELNSSSNNTPEYDSLGNPIETEEPFEFTSDSLIRIALELQQLKSGAKLGSDEKFADLIDTKGDVHFWFNVGKMYSNTLTGSLLSLSKLGSLLEGNISTATVSFEKGAIEVESKGYVGKELEALYKKYSASAFDETALTQLPAGEINMALAMNYPPEGLKALLSLFGVDGLVNTYMQEAGFSVDEFIRANSGNLFLSLSDFQIKKVEKSFEGFDGKPFTYTTTEPDGKLLFGAQVKDPSAFQKMMDVARKLLTGKAGMSEEELKKIPYTMKDKWFLSGNDSIHMNNYGSQKTSHAFIDRIKGHPFGMFINLRSFIKGASQEMGDDPMSKGAVELSQKFWKDIVLTGGDFKKGASVSHLTLSLGDAQTNSLTSLNQYFGQIAQLAKEDQERREKDLGNEPVDTTPVRID